jgi:hypothetical protein
VQTPMRGATEARLADDKAELIGPHEPQGQPSCWAKHPRDGSRVTRNPYPGVRGPLGTAFFR